MDKNNGNPNSATTERRLDSIKDSVKDFVDHGQERVQHLKDRAVDVQKQAMTYLDRAAEFIKANPMKSVAIAFGAGYLGMRIFRR
jgi:ElaB/YqjD/DUF883 family membrane-anchored ribosome-binding protein